MTDVSMADQEGLTAEGTGGDMDAGAGSAGGTVICTICHNDDGTFTLYQGDEPGEEPDEAAAAGPIAGEAGPGGAAPPPGAGAQGEEAPGAEGQEAGEPADEGEHFDTIGDLMKAVLETVKSADEGKGGAEESFGQGFAEESPPAPGTSSGPKPGM